MSPVWRALRDLAWLEARTLKQRRHQLRRRRHGTTAFPVIESGDVALRPLQHGDTDAWTESMRANGPRMMPWWETVADWDRATDARAFWAHHRQWTRAARRGTGICLAVTHRGRLVGEVQLWHMSPGGATLEVGLWARPGLPGRDLAAVLAGLTEHLVTELGIRRADAPVAVGNDQPVALLQLLGFRREGLLRQWRHLHGTLVDHIMYGVLGAEALAAVDRMRRDYTWSTRAAGPGRPS